MSTKKLYVILMCVILIAVAVTVSVIGETYYSSHTNTLRVGSNFASVPEGYEVVKVSEHGGVMNGGDTKLSVYFTDTAAQVEMDKYVAKHENDTLINETDDFGDVKVYKFTLLDNATNDTKITHLYFDKDNVPYHIAVDGEYDKSAIETVINSI